MSSIPGIAALRLSPLQPRHVPAAMKIAADALGFSFPELGADEEFVRRTLLRPENCSFIASAHDEPIGYLLGGICGLRAFLREIRVIKEWQGRGVGHSLVRDAKDRCASLGVRRIIVSVPGDNPALLSFWETEGFARAPGEETLCRGGSFNDHQLLPTRVEAAQPQTIRVLPLKSDSHLHSALAAMQGVDEVALQPWETPELLRQAVQSDGSLSLVAEQGGKPVGFIIGGAFGSWGWINHTLVLPEHQGLGVGGLLVDAFVPRASALGVHSIFATVTAGNDRARKFWENRGFKATSGRITLECDI